MDSEDPEIVTGGTEVFLHKAGPRLDSRSSLRERDPPVHEGEAPEILITWGQQAQDCYLSRSESCLAHVTPFLTVSTLPLISNVSTLRNVHYKSSLCASRILQCNLQVMKITKIRKDERQSSDYKNKMTM